MTGSFSMELSAAAGAAFCDPLPFCAWAVPTRSAGSNKLKSLREYFINGLLLA
jgi:hypothetical protein